MKCPLSVLCAGPRAEWRFVLANTPSKVCLTGISVHADVNRHPFPASCFVLVFGTDRCPDLAKHVK